MMTDCLRIAREMAARSADKSLERQGLSLLHIHRQHEHEREHREYESGNRTHSEGEPEHLCGNRPVPARKQRE